MAAGALRNRTVGRYRTPPWLPLLAATNVRATSPRRRTFWLDRHSSTSHTHPGRKGLECSMRRPVALMSTASRGVIWQRRTCRRSFMRDASGNRVRSVPFPSPLLMAGLPMMGLPPPLFRMAGWNPATMDRDRCWPVNHGRGRRIDDDRWLHVHHLRWEGVNDRGWRRSHDRGRSGVGRPSEGIDQDPAEDDGSRTNRYSLPTMPDGMWIAGQGC